MEVAAAVHRIQNNRGKLWPRQGLHERFALVACLMSSFLSLARTDWPGNLTMVDVPFHPGTLQRLGVFIY